MVESVLEFSILSAVRIRISLLPSFSVRLRLLLVLTWCIGLWRPFSRVKLSGFHLDRLCRQNGARLIVDELSMTFLEECEIDYTEASGFVRVI